MIRGSAVAAGAMYDVASAFKDGEGLTQGGGSHAAELAQLLQGNGSFYLRHGLDDPAAWIELFFGGH